MKRPFPIRGGLAVMCLAGILAIGSSGVPAFGQDFMYKEFDGVILFYTPKDT